MKKWKQFLVMLAVVPMLSAALGTGVADATGCKVVTNPATSGAYLFWSQGGNTYTLEVSVPFTTGDASSGCNDVNVRYFKQFYLSDYSSSDCLVQYKSGDFWYSDSKGLVYVPLNSSTPTVLGSGYANNASVRIACLYGYGRQYPTYQALV